MFKNFDGLSSIKENSWNNFWIDNKESWDIDGWI